MRRRYRLSREMREYNLQLRNQRSQERREAREKILKVVTDAGRDLIRDPGFRLRDIGKKFHCTITNDEFGFCCGIKKGYGLNYADEELFGLLVEAFKGDVIMNYHLCEPCRKAYVHYVSKGELPERLQFKLLRNVEL